MSNDNRPPETLLQGCADFRRAPLYRAADPTLNIRTATPSALSFPALNGGACRALGQAKKWTQAVRKRLPNWITQHVQPVIQAVLTSENLNARFN